MASPADLQTAVRHLGSLQQRAAITIERGEGSWRKELVALRREVSAASGHVADLISRLQAADQADPVLIEFARQFRNLRTTLAVHEASWPAIMIDPANAECRASGLRIRSTFEALEAQLKLVMTGSKTTGRTPG